MRTLWKGAISFGLVNVPIKMYAATQKNEIKFHYLHDKCKTPIKYQKYCPACNVEVPPEEIVWGYEHAPGNYVVLREEDFDRLPGESTRTIDILDFVDLAEIDPIYFDKSYYLEPNQGGEKAYALLKKAMLETGRIAVARVVIRSKETLCALRVANNVLVMATMFYPDEVRSAAGLSGVIAEPALHDNEIKMATSLIGNLSSRFEAAKYTNHYREELVKLIEAKIAGREVYAPAEPAPGKIIDLTEALRASLAATEKKGAEKKKEPALAGGGGRRRQAK